MSARVMRTSVARGQTLVEFSVAGALGSENAYRSSSWVRVKARVSYGLDVGGMVIGGPVGTYTRDIDRVYLVQRRYEIS